MAIVSTTGPVPADVKGWNPSTGGTVFAAHNRRPRRTPLTRLMAPVIARSAAAWWQSLNDPQRASWKLPGMEPAYNRRGTTWDGKSGWVRWWARTAAEILSSLSTTAVWREPGSFSAPTISILAANAASQTITTEITGLAWWDLLSTPCLSIFQIGPRSRYHVGHDPSTRLLGQVRMIGTGVTSIVTVSLARFRLYAGRSAGVYLRAHDSDTWHDPATARITSG